VSPGEIIVLYPSNVGPQVMIGAELDAEGRITTTLGETRVLFDGLPAPVSYTVRGEVGAVVPYEIAGRGSTNVVVEYLGRKSEPVSIPVANSNPSLFTQNRIGTGQAGILNDTGCCNSPANPAARGSMATVYATGEGLLRGGVVSGSMSAYKTPSDYPRPQLPVRLTVGGVPAELDFVAAAPHAVAGLLQINFRVPITAPLGDAVPLVLTVGEASSAPLATMSVRAVRDQVLVAESDPAVRAWLRKIVAKAGYEVYEARDGKEAMAQARAQALDLVVLDLQGTNAEKQEWLRTMRSARPRLKVIAVVGVLNTNALREADLLGAQAVVVRPLSANTVIDRVYELIRRRTVIYDAGDAWPLPARPH
jgi:uncharacterized protein (TIGR03437 family)